MRNTMLVAAVLCAAPLVAQDRAPRETVTAEIDGKTVAIEYGRPALKGRAMGELLSQLPEDRVWRAGVDQATTLTTPVDLMIGETRVPAGKYTVYMHVPADGAYAVILNSDPGVPLKTVFAAAPAELADALWPRSDYGDIAAKEVARIPLTSIKAAAPMERFNIAFDPARDGVSALTFTWGDQAWTTGVKPAAAK